MNTDDLELTQAQQKLVDALERHRSAELDELDVDATLKTMVAKPSILFLANLAGGVGEREVRRFYTQLVSQQPADIEWGFVSRTIGNDQIVVESILQFTHEIQMDWVFPGVPPSNQFVRIPLCIVFSFDGELLKSERIYWDHHSAMKQIGITDSKQFPSDTQSAATHLLESVLKVKGIQGDARCPFALGEIQPHLVPVRGQLLGADDKTMLWQLFVAINAAWGIGDADKYRSGWDEFIQAKTEGTPDYTAEYCIAAAVAREVLDVYGDSLGRELLLFHHGVPEGPPLTRLAHTRRYVIDEFIRVQIVLGGFQSFVKDHAEQANYRGYVAGSRYNRLPTVRPLLPLPKG